MSKAYPHHYEAEQAVLGIIFLDPREIVSVIDKLQKNDFFDSKHQLIFGAMSDLYHDGAKIDYRSVAAKLELTNNLGNAGGYQYLVLLADSIPSVTHLDTYMDLVLDGSMKRQVISVTSKLAEAGFNATDANNYLAKAEEEIFAIAKKRKTTEFVPIGNVVNEVREKIEKNRNKKGGITGISTGFSNLDQLTAGLQPEELMILAARPSMGKSAFAMNLALNIASKNDNSTVAIFSLEMSNDQLASRMLSTASAIESKKIKIGQLSPKEWGELEAGLQTLAGLNIVFDDSAAVSVNDIRAKCRKLSQSKGLDFVVIDYLQLIRPEDRAGNRQEEVARISRSLKQMARELRIPVLALSQLSRDVEKREDKRPVLADLRESGSIEQDADIVCFLYRKDYYDNQKSETKTSDVDLIIAKNRQGMAGIELKFKFDTEYSRFRATDDRNEDDSAYRD